MADEKQKLTPQSPPQDGTEDVVSPPEQLTFHDITDASNFAPTLDLPLWVTLLLLGGLILTTLLLITLIRKKKIHPPFRINSYTQARKKLPSLKKKLAAQSIGSTASELSLILRDALKQETHCPALFQTQREFLSSETLPLKNTQLAREATDLLNTLWALEYAPPTQDVEKGLSLLQEAEQLLEKLARP